MNNYQDKNGMWHEHANRIDNNVYKYGAIAKILGLDVSRYPAYFNRCKQSLTGDNITILRHPPEIKTDLPPTSAEEAIGMMYLKLLPYGPVKQNHFVFHGHGEKLDERALKKMVEGLLKLVMAHNVNIFMSKKRKVKQRNLFWRYNIDEVGYFAFRFNPGQIYYIKRASGVKPHEEERLLKDIYVDSVLSTKNASHINTLFILAMYANDHKLARKCNPWKYIPKEFPADHPFTAAVKHLKL